MTVTCAARHVDNPLPELVLQAQILLWTDHRNRLPFVNQKQTEIGLHFSLMSRLVLARTRVAPIMTVAEIERIIGVTPAPNPKHLECS
jgi:hypothetical protein